MLVKQSAVVSKKSISFNYRGGTIIIIRASSIKPEFLTIEEFTTTVYRTSRVL